MRVLSGGPSEGSLSSVEALLFSSSCRGRPETQREARQPLGSDGDNPARTEPALRTSSTVAPVPDFQCRPHDHVGSGSIF